MNIDPAFFEHWKTRTLCEALADPSAPLYVLRLWAHCQLRKRWTFDTLSPAALKTLCCFPGNANKLDSSLAASGFVRRDGSTLIVCNWDEYNADLIEQWKVEEAKKPKAKAAPKPKVETPETPAEEGDAPPPQAKYPPRFEEWYFTYPKHVGKEAALRAWTRAGKLVKNRLGCDSPTACNFLLDAAKAYAKSDEGLSEFCPHPASWLNAGKYDDDREQWQRCDATPAKPGVKASDKLKRLFPEQEEAASDYH